MRGLKDDSWKSEVGGRAGLWVTDQESEFGQNSKCIVNIQVEVSSRQEDL